MRVAGAAGGNLSSSWGSTREGAGPTVLFR